jgi:hypothetical protein
MTVDVKVVFARGRDAVAVLAGWYMT